MLIPPPVGVEAYPTVAGSETRSDYLRNYLRAGLTINSTYSDNVIATVDTQAGQRYQLLDVAHHSTRPDHTPLTLDVELPVRLHCFISTRGLVITNRTRK